MDFGKINTADDSNLGATHHVIDPYTEEPAYVRIGKEDVPVTIKVLGPDSDQMRKFQGTMLKSMMKKRKAGMDADELERKMVSQLVEATVSWTGVMQNGEELECTRENARALYEKHSWLREQLMTFQQDRMNFLPR